MSEPSVPRRRRWLRLLLYFFAFSAVVLGLLAWYSTTDSFQQFVRRRVVATLERTTGGRVEIGEFHTIPFRMRVDVRNLVIRGREAADQLPFFQVERLDADARITSLLGATVRLHSLRLEHPVVHIVVNPDGSTNAPVPPESRASGRGPVEDLFALKVSRIEVERGELLWQQERIPLDLRARDVGLNLRYSFLHQRYQAQVQVGGASTQYRNYPPLDWRADASLVFSPEHAEISRLNVVSGESELNFSGRLDDYRVLRVNGEYRGNIDAAELAAFVRQPGLRKGTIHIEGKGSWNARDFSSQGTLSARDIEWAAGALRTQNSRMNAAFSVTPQRLQISSIRASAFGGEVQGDVDVNNWQTPLVPETARRPAAGRGPATNPQRGSVRLQMKGFPLAPALALLSTRKLPLDRMNLAASASGKVDALWVGAIRDAEIRADLAIAEPQKPTPGQLPVSGQIAGAYLGSRDELQVDRFRLRTPGSEITASGSLSATSSLKLNVDSHALNEWRPLLQAAYGSGDMPFAIRGWATFSGTATGRVSALQLAGNLEVYDFDTTLPARDGHAARTLHWDAVTAAIQYSPSNVSVRNGVLIHGHAAARFDASLGLLSGRAQQNSPFTLRLDVRGADLAEIAQMAGVQHPVSGTGELSLHASGTWAHPRGEGRVEVRDARVDRAPVEFLRSDLRLNDDLLQFNNVEARVFDAPLSGGVTLNLANRQFTLNLTGRDLNLAQFPQLQTSRFSVEGLADVTARASGTPEQPVIDANVHIRDLSFDKERAGDLYVDAVTQGRQVAVHARSEFEKADLKVDGLIGVEDGYPADLDVAFHNLDIDALLNIYVPGRVTSHSSLAGAVSLHGPLRTPRELKVSARLDSVDAEIAHVRLRNSEPVRFEFADHVIRLESMRLSVGGTDFTAHGRAVLGDPGEMDFRLDGTIGMELLQTLNPKLSSRGVMGVSLNVAGTPKNPVLQGRLDVKDTFVSHNDFPSGLSNLNGTLLFDQNRIQIEKLEGTTGGGSIALSGSSSYRNGVLLLDIGATARDVRMRYPPGVSSTANADLRLTGSSNSALLSGEIVVNKVGVTPGFDFAAYAERGKRTVAATGSDSLESRLKLDVRVVTTPELQMQTAIAKLSGSADLRVRGTADRPVITGRVNANEGGQLSFNGTKYNVERLEITMSNPAKTVPVIDVQASTRVRDYDITVNISGDLSVPNSLKPTWHSEPPLPEADVIALLALGRTREESAALQASGGGGFGAEASNLLLNEALNTALTSRMQRLFGVSRIKIDPQGMLSATNVVRGPQVTIEQQVANNFTITYSTNVSVASQQVIQVEYNVTRNISIVGVRDQNGVVSFDVKIRQRKK